ncbi:hypothetical protein GCM10022252_01080 [Streptosporangium oxazolinicum]|uniref:Transcriptional regulator n=1 Tax=Streptosporangium oxazolinicum TaxID=909287 RepID=A0ABP8A7R3_9ACTN
MPPRPRSLKRQMDVLTTQMREHGATWSQIAADYQLRFKLNPLRGFREAHRYTQSKVVQLWNLRWPDDVLSERRLGAWEAWPSVTGNEPPISGLERLARIYQCRAGDLVHGEDHSRDDDRAGRRPAATDEPAPRPVLTVTDIASFLGGLPTRSPGDEADRVLAVADLRGQEFGYLVAALTQWADGMKRRDLLAVIASAAATAHASPLLAHLDRDALERLTLASRAPSRVDGEVVGHVETILHHAIRQEDILGPQAVLETALAQHGLVRRLLTGTADEDLRHRLMSLLADISRFIGWLLFNSGDFAGAEHYYGQARRAAHEADDDLMSSYVLAQWSHLATWSGDPRLGVEHALGALAWAQRGGSPILIAYANDVGARAYAGVLRRENDKNRAKDRARCRAALSAARAGLDDSTEDDPGRNLTYFFGPAMLTLTRALCHLDMREPDSAIACAREAMTSIGTAFPRNLAFGHLYLSRAFAQKREIDQACAELARAAELAGRNRSPRLVAATADARQALSPWNHADPVVRLDERLRSYGLPAGRSSST